MDPISSEVVERTWKKMGGMSPKNAPKMINRMQKEQPLILAYLMAVDHDVLNREERELLLYIGIVVWQIMSQGNKKMPEITEKTLNEAERLNEKMTDYLHDESEAGFVESVDKIFANYNQSEVLLSVIGTLAEEVEEGSIKDENIGIMVLALKTVIDCFDR